MKYVAVVLTTRGLVFTEVEEAIEKSRAIFTVKGEQVHVQVFRSSSLPIPECHNQLTQNALLTNPDYIWYIEEDTVPPANALYNLIAADADVTFIDYAINGWACAAKYTDGEILWCGLGCTLVRAGVFRKLERPFFRTDKSLSLNEDTYFKWLDIPNKYGGQDIWFFSQAREAGFKIIQVPGECKHMKIDELGKPGVNNGFHQLSQKPRIKNQAIHKRPLTMSEKLDDNKFDMRGGVHFG